MFSYQIIPYTLNFRFEAKTSRGSMMTKKTWFIKLTHADFPNRVGWGECGPLKGLSPETETVLEENMHLFSDFVVSRISSSPAQWDKISTKWLNEWTGPWLPSLVFAWECAFLDWQNGGRQLICDPLFHGGQWSVPINGLVWMNERKTMFDQAMEKADHGFSTIKIKVGALDWKEELGLLRDLRQELSSDKFIIRLDANGAWTHAEAISKLEELYPFDIHSIEQPIAPGQLNELAELCQRSPIPIALDEELIGKPFDDQKFELLEQVQPPHLVLKPTLLGGLGQTDQWIKMAEDLGIDWWITSMLESNIGLNAVSQLAAQYRPVLPQGLGTGGLYENNIQSPLKIQDGMLSWNPKKSWEFDCIQEGKG